MVIDLVMIIIINKSPLRRHYTSNWYYYISIVSRSPYQNYASSRERSSSFDNFSFLLYKSQYRSPCKPHNDRFRGRLHSNPNIHSNCFGGSSRAKTEELKTEFELERLKELKDRVQAIEIEGTQVEFKPLL